MTPFLLPIQETISTAWSKVSGSKGSFWAAIGICILFGFGIGIITGIISPDQNHPTVFGSILQFISAVIQYLFSMGLLYIGIQRAFDNPISYRLIFKVLEFKTALKLIGFYLLQVLLWILIFLVILVFISLFVIFNSLTHLSALTFSAITAVVGFFLFFMLIYFLVRIALTPAFIMDKNSGLFAAIKLSISATRNNFWRIILLGFISILFFIASIIPLGIGLIWSIPFAYILYGIIYKNLLVNNLLIKTS